MVASRMSAICLTNLSKGLRPSPPCPCKLSDAPVPCRVCYELGELRSCMHERHGYHWSTGLAVRLSHSPTDCNAVKKARRCC